MSGLLSFNEVQNQSHTTLRELIVLSVFNSADSDVTVSLVVPFVWLPSLGRKFEIINLRNHLRKLWILSLKAMYVKNEVGIPALFSAEDCYVAIWTFYSFFL